jgi:hypothetical protein
MASSDYSGPAAGNSVSEVLKVANTELRKLRAHHRMVTERIRRLRIVVDALGELGANAASSQPGDRTASPEPAARGLSGVTWAARDSIRGSNKHHARNTAGRTRSRNPDLRRACRIALLETLDAISREEVYERIVRRGSFRFASGESAASSIVEELNAMTKHGELRRIQGPFGWLWQRVPPATESGEPAIS